MRCRGMILKRSAGLESPGPSLPHGYTWSPFQPGEDVEWARIETWVGEVDTRWQHGPISPRILRRGRPSSANACGLFGAGREAVGHRAIGLYQQYGFATVEETFAGSANQYHQAMDVLNQIYAVTVSSLTGEPNTRVSTAIRS